MRRITDDWIRSKGAQQVCAMLTGAGHQAWFVGGCVRNALLGAPVSDLDIATDARPDAVMARAAAAGLKPVPTGIDHGTVTVVADGAPFEVTTFRRDLETDGRRAVVAFADTMAEDAGRRDFTMNALYAAPDGTVVDPLGGLPDLEARRVRFIGDPHDRIREEYLRILRFFRCHARYGSDGLDRDGYAACAELSEGLEGLSKERIGHEFRKLLAAPDPAPAVASMEAAGVLLRVLPGSRTGQLPVLVHLEGEAGLARDWQRRLVALGGDPAQALRLSRAEARRIEALSDATQGEAGPGELGYRLGAIDAIDALVLRASLHVQPFDPVAAQEAGFGANQVLPIKAADLADRHVGPALGKALKEAEARWIASGFRLTRQDLLA